MPSSKLFYHLCQPMRQVLTPDALVFFSFLYNILLKNAKLLVTILDARIGRGDYEYEHDSSIKSVECEARLD